MDRRTERNVVVCNLESSRFDVSYFVVDNGVFEMLALASDLHLGGDTL